MKRPTLHDVETCHAVAKRFISPLFHWLDDEDAKAIDIEKDLLKAFKAAFDWGPCSIVREFDKMEYFVDAELFHIFEAANLLAIDETQKRVRAWVITEGVLPAFAVGDQVVVSPVYGTIIRVDAETAEYVVQCPVVGHSGAAGYVVPFEKVVGR